MKYTDRLLETELSLRHTTLSAEDSAERRRPSRVGSDTKQDHNTSSRLGSGKPTRAFGETRHVLPWGWCRWASDLLQEPSAVCTGVPSPSEQPWRLQNRTHTVSLNRTSFQISLEFGNRLQPLSFTVSAPTECYRSWETRTTVKQWLYFSAVSPGSFFSIGFLSASSGNTNTISGEERRGEDQMRKYHISSRDFTPQSVHSWPVYISQSESREQKEVGLT